MWNSKLMTFWRKKRNNDVLGEVKDLRLKVREDVYAELSKEHDNFVREGKYPFEAGWFRLSTISILQKKLKWKDRIVLIELLLLYTFMLFLSYVAYRLLIFYFLPR